MVEIKRSRLARSAGGTLPRYDLPSRQNVLVRYSTGAIADEVFTTGDAVDLVRPEIATPDEWVRAHIGQLGKYEGRWLAVSKTGIVGIGDSLPEVRASADAKGLPRADVIVFKLPGHTPKKAVSTRKR